MALKIIETKEVIEDGVTYIIRIYSNGTVTKSAKSTAPAPEDAVLTPAEQQEARELYIMAML